ncbi:MAG: transketolase [Desulfobacterales bacterium]|jgi:transketolase|nr:transketolase [Desulfobacterales bacterium]
MANRKPSIEELCVNTIRGLAMDAVEAASSGHPGAPMGLAPAGFVLWTQVLKHNPADPGWADRDRFVLSGGHASALLYSLLHLCGYDLPLEEIRRFRQWGSRTPGHPEFRHTPGVETTTGPLGQGIANAVGMAIAERHLAARFNRGALRVVDHFTYVFCGDGDLMEGVASEAASLAGHLGLARLICLYDDNRVTIDGGTHLSFTENVAQRFRAYGWQVLRVADGNDLRAIRQAFTAARAESAKPSLIVCRTQIAYGSPNKQGSHEAHGAPLGPAEVRLAKERLNLPPEESFWVPAPVRARFQRCLQSGAKSQAAWRRRFDAWSLKHPELAGQWRLAMDGGLPPGWDADLPDFADAKPIATRSAFGLALNAVASKLPALMGGSADLTPSNNTSIAGARDFQKDAPQGRYLRFGVREHAMGGVLSGLALHGGVRPYGGTFLVFADYMRPAMRLAALMRLPVIYIFTHDSIAVGEDGPTHQPVEQLASLRAIPGLTVIRPADATETAAAWRLALQKTDGPVALLLSRQSLPVIDRRIAPAADLLRHGAYTLADPAAAPAVILIASGSEVSVALQAQRMLAARGVAARVVSMPSWELFEQAPAEYRDSVLPPRVTARVAIEAGSPMGWERYAQAGVFMSGFGASAPGAAVMEKFGFTAEALAAKALAVLGGHAARG